MNWASLVAQLVKNLPAMQETPSSIPGSGRSAGEVIGIPVFLGFPGGSDSKESICNVGDLDLIPGLGRCPGGGPNKLLQYSCLGNPHAQRSLAGYSPRGCKKLDTTEQLSTARHTTEFTVVLGNTRCTYMKNAKAIQNNKMCVCV